MEERSYYSIIPANVKCDKKLPDKAKLLFGDISGLANDKGYCFATNAFFADIFGVSKDTISRLIARLEKSGYIKSELVYSGKEIKERRLYINITPTPQRWEEVSAKSARPIGKNADTPIGKNAEDINTSIIITSTTCIADKPQNPARKSKQPFIKPSIEEIKKYCDERKNGIDAEKFFNHYEIGGWVYGRARIPIKDWKAAVRTWEKNGYSNGNTSPPNEPTTPTYRRYEG
jgi:DNA-binding Lrp family transcriptional regulator